MSRIDPLLADHLDLWTSAMGRRSSTGRGRSKKFSLYGIEKLRALILNLAVRGKLVAQNPHDEPASELLKLIKIARKQLIAEKKIRHPREFAEGNGAKAAFSIPESWMWVRLDTIGAIVGGGTPSANDPENFAESGSGFPWLTPADLGGYTGLYIERGARDLSEKGLSKSSATVLPKNTVLFTSRAPIGYVAIASNPITTNQGFKSVVPYISDSSQYIALALRAFAREINENAPATTFKEVSGKIVAAVPFPLPPLNEQHRIVAKVDELMALCDRLEAENYAAIEAHQLLVVELLATLTVSCDASELADNWSRIATHFDALFVTEESVDRLQHTILQMAVMGRLVPQDPGDEPASELFKNIKAENKKLALEKGIRLQKATLPAKDLEAKSNIPPSWEHLYLQDLAYQITDGTHLTPKYTDSGKPFLSAQNVKPFRFLPDNHRFVSRVDFDAYRASRKAEYGDILMTRVGAGIGEAAVLDSDLEFAFYVSLCLIKIPTKYLLSEYLVLWLNSVEGRQSSSSRTYGKGTSQGNLNLGLIRTFRIPVPPLAEQRRIVAKVDHSMKLCETLRARLRLANEHKVSLADAAASLEDR